MVKICKAQRTELHQLNPTKAKLGELLPPGYSRSYFGFLLVDLQREIQVDQYIVQHESEHLKNFGVIASIIGKRPPVL
jgi:hypothetical protein